MNRLRFLKAALVAGWVVGMLLFFGAARLESSEGPWGRACLFPTQSARDPRQRECNARSASRARRKRLIRRARLRSITQKDAGNFPRVTRVTTRL